MKFKKDKNFTSWQVKREHFIFFVCVMYLSYEHFVLLKLLKKPLFLFY